MKTLELRKLSKKKKKKKKNERTGLGGVRSKEMFPEKTIQKIFETDPTFPMKKCHTGKA